jgi:hypothetical protein
MMQQLGMKITNGLGWDFNFSIWNNIPSNATARGNTVAFISANVYVQKDAEV